MNRQPRHHHEHAERVRGANEEIRAWQARSRLDILVRQIAALNGTETEVFKELGRYGRLAARAAANASLLSAN
jgi:hypothetical protein